MTERTVNFEPQIEVFTIVYDKEGNEINRLPGRVEISGRDYEDQLPIEYRQIEVATTLINVVRIERRGDK